MTINSQIHQTTNKKPIFLMKLFALLSSMIYSSNSKTISNVRAKTYLSFIFAAAPGLIIPSYALGEMKLTFTKIVDTETRAPGKKELFSILNLPYIDLNKGQSNKFTFEGFGRQPGGEDLFASNGIFLYDGKTLISIADTTSLLPNNSNTITAFDENISMRGGKVAFTAYYGDNQSGVYVATINSGIQKIADSSTSAPNSFNLLKKFGAPSLSLGGTVGFWSRDEQGAEGIYYSKRGDSIKALIDTSSMTDNENFSSFSYQPSITDNAAIFAGTTSTGRSGVFLSHLESFQQPIVNVVETTELKKPINRSFYPDPIFANDEFIFYGIPPDERALYKGKVLGNTIEVIKIAGFDTPIPQGIGTFSNIGSASIDPETGHVAFIGSGSNGQTGLYLFLEDYHVEKIVDLNDILVSKRFKPSIYCRPIDISRTAVNGDSLVFTACFSDTPLDMAIIRVTGLLQNQQEIE